MKAVLAVAVVAAAIAAGAATVAEAAYRPAGAYLDFAQRPSLIDGLDRVAEHESDSGGRGIVEILPDGRRIHGVISDSFHGLWHWTQFVRTGRRSHLAEARRAARWMRRKQDGRTGRYPARYTFDLGPRSDGTHNLVLHSPWYGANSQGIAISLLTRLYRATGSRDYLLQARRALRPFRRRFGRGGVVSRFLGGEHPFYEGYATLRVPVHTLVHHIYTLVGLYDMREFSPFARRLFDEGFATLRVALPRYQGEGGRTAAWLAHLTDPPRPFQPLLGFYQEEEISALKALNSVRGDGTVRRHMALMSAALATICRDPAELCFYGHDG